MSVDVRSKNIEKWTIQIFLKNPTILYFTEMPLILSKKVSIIRLIVPFIRIFQKFSLGPVYLTHLCVHLDQVPNKKPIRIEDQVVTDENGRRRFHGAFTGGFSAGYYNSVGSKEGWRPAEFKSSRSDRSKRDQKPQDFMDEEDLGAFGIAPQILRAKDYYSENNTSKRQRQIFAAVGAIPGIYIYIHISQYTESSEQSLRTLHHLGLPALHGILNPVKETIGVKLLRMMGWKPNQGTGTRKTRREKKEKKEKMVKAYGCLLPPTLAGAGKTTQSSDEGSDDDEHLFAPDDLPTFTVQPKDNCFGLGYSGLMPRGKSLASKSQFVLFEPTLSVTDKRKKLQIAGQAFGVGAFENDDEDIYAKDDMSRYDFELGGSRAKKPDSKMLALPHPDLLDGFVRASHPEPRSKAYPLPDLPRDFNPIHRNKKSRFDVQPLSEKELKGLGRHDLNAFQRAAILNEVLDVNADQSSTYSRTIVTQHSSSSSSAAFIRQEGPVAGSFEAVLNKVKMEVAASQKAAEKPPPPDPDKQIKAVELKKFIDTNLTPSTFQPFSKDPSKQYRFDAYNILSKAGRLNEFHVLFPDSMTEWQREREKVSDQVNILRTFLFLFIFIF